MAIYKGDKKIIALYKGDKKIIKRYNGTQVLYQLETDYDLAFEFTGSSVSYMINMDSYTASTSPYKVLISNLGVDDFTNAYHMFYGDSNITMIDRLPDTSNVIMMQGMFYYCSGLTSLDTTNLKTSSCQNMDSMFDGCSSLTSLDVSNFDISKVTKTSYMFRSCENLTSLDVSNWSVSAVTDMSYMFDSCYNLTSLDLSNWDTSNVTDMEGMFWNCYSLSSLEVSTGFNVSNVTSMYHMFENCSGLGSLNLSNWDFSKVNDMSYMFANCNTLSSLNLDGCVIDSGITYSYTYMFQNCPLTSISMYGCNCDTIKFIADRLIDASIISTYEEAKYIIQTENIDCLEDSILTSPEILEDCNTQINVLYVDYNFASAATQVFRQYIYFGSYPCASDRTDDIYIDPKGNGDEIYIYGTPYTYTTTEPVGDYGNMYYKIPIKEMVGYPIYLTNDTADKVQQNARGIFYYQ